MVDSAILLRRLASVRHCLERLDSKRTLVQEEFLRDLDAQDVVLRNLQVGIQAALDIALHIIRDSGWELPGASVGSFEILARQGVLSPELAARLRLAGQMRNLLVHVYDAIDITKVFQAYQVSVDDLEAFSRAIVAYYEL